MNLGALLFAWPPSASQRPRRVPRRLADCSSQKIPSPLTRTVRSCENDDLLQERWQLHSWVSTSSVLILGHCSLADVLSFFQVFLCPASACQRILSWTVFWPRAYLFRSANGPRRSTAPSPPSALLSAYRFPLRVVSSPCTSFSTNCQTKWFSSYCGPQKYRRKLRYRRCVWVCVDRSVTLRKKTRVPRRDADCLSQKVLSPFTCTVTSCEDGNTFMGAVAVTFVVVDLDFLRPDPLALLSHWRTLFKNEFIDRRSFLIYTFSF